MKIKDTLHLKAPGNWINDPNGFICYQNKYHLFYQYFPYAPAWGTMHWGHAVSEDLVHWEHLGIAVFPTKAYDRNGIFSGSAIEKDGELYLFYSAVRYLEEEPENIHLCVPEQFETSQALLVSKDGYSFDNWGDKQQILPVIREEETAHPVHTRDPKVWKYKDTYYMILGSTRGEKQGKALFYKSRDAREWEYVNQYCDAKFGRILECPDVFSEGDSYVFMGSSMWIMDDGLEYSHQSVCTTAGFREESCELELPETVDFVDYGLDLYAPQTALDKEGRRVMIGWMRMPETVDGKERIPWNGMMCLPRVVKVQDGQIHFRVHPEVDACFGREISVKTEIDYDKPFRVKAVLKEDELLDIGGYRIWVEDDCIKTDRSRVFGEIEGYRTSHSTPPLGGSYELDIFVEPNLIEIFVNGGQRVLSSVVYGMGRYITGPAGQIYAMEEKGM